MVPPTFQQPPVGNPQPFHVQQNNQMATPVQQPSQHVPLPSPPPQPTPSVQGYVQPNQPGLDMDEETIMGTLVTDDKFGAWKNYAKHGQSQFIEAYDGVAKHIKRKLCDVHRQNILYEEYKKRMGL